MGCSTYGKYIVANEADGEGISLYQTCSGSRTSADSIVRKIDETTKPFQPVALEEHGVSFALSFMLAFMGFSRKQVNNALGTGLSKQEYEARAEAVRAIIAEEGQDEANIPSTVPAREGGNAEVEIGRKRGRNTETSLPETNTHRPTAPVGETQTRTSDRSHNPTSTATPQGRPDPSLNNSERPMSWPDSEEQAATSAADIRVDQRSPDATTMLVHAAHRSGNQHDDDPRLTTAETGSPDTGMDPNHRKGGAGGPDRYGTNDVWMGYIGLDNGFGWMDDIIIEDFCTGHLL
ncbi:hypothetical protein DL765_009885 [Monosporascus sp. GIB2]|nr:hypothetical protein DL765_009885 [Monosporascus sp. GIB2]